MSQATGSSPLARGLLLADTVLQVGLGIIPARAGFTPRGGQRQLHLGWIIPARAGFTGRLHTLGAAPPDHPRSRGVYIDQSIAIANDRGSSPLARGLLAAALGMSWRERIIPARAGFTRRGARAGRSPGDHPRSRGVYSWATCGRTASPGSSPLARGLPAPRPRPRRGARIIPARAGFTNRPGGPCSWAWDHPRSRGVYRTVCARSAPARGRIIPARAGFTGDRSQRCGHHPDHPRSRGVYCGRTPPSSTSRGSSPLARGLLGALGARA